MKDESVFRNNFETTGTNIVIFYLVILPKYTGQAVSEPAFKFGNYQDKKQEFEQCYRDA
jgi:hypothetical protein